jgi:arsenate reductase (thioredoxin)
MDRPFGILFISRRNSARSLMAEAVVRKQGEGKFNAYSAGVEPTPEVDLLALDILRQTGYPTEGLRPKHWQAFVGGDAPVLDFIFTLSATAAAHAFPGWPGKPVAAQWRYPDPTKAVGDDWQRRRAYSRVLSALERQMRIFLALPIASLDRIALGKRLAELRADGYVEPSAPVE